MFPGRTRSESRSTSARRWKKERSESRNCSGFGASSRQRISCPRRATTRRRRPPVRATWKAELYDAIDGSRTLAEIALACRARNTRWVDSSCVSSRLGFIKVRELREPKSDIVRREHRAGQAEGADGKRGVRGGGRVDRSLQSQAGRGRIPGDAHRQGRDGLFGDGLPDPGSSRMRCRAASTGTSPWARKPRCSRARTSSSWISLTDDGTSGR